MEKESTTPQTQVLLLRTKSFSFLSFSQKPEEEKEEEDEVFRSEVELPVVQVPRGDTITIRIPDSKTTETNEINLYINGKPVTTLDDEESRITIEKDGQTDNYVVISDAQPDDVGRYTVEFNGKLQSICMLEVTPARPKVSQAEIPVQQPLVEEVKDEEEEEEEEEEVKPGEIPTHEVVEGDNVNLTIERPSGTDIQKVVLFLDGEKLQPNDSLTIKSVSSTSTEITINKVKPDDEGTYAVQFGDQPKQNLMNLKVLPKPVVRDSLRLPKDVFEEGETLTIQCDFAKKPDEKLVWKLNDKPLNLLKDERVLIEALDDGKSFVLTIKGLRSDTDQGVYKLEGPHLVLETPFVRVIQNVKEEEEETTILLEDEETETFELQRKPKKESVEPEEVRMKNSFCRTRFKTHAFSTLGTRNYSGREAERRS